MNTRQLGFGALAGLAAAMGLGRFVYTPILPLMQEQAGISPGSTAVVATFNYFGYFLGALALAVWPRLARSRGLLRASLVALVASEVAMVLAVSVPLWSGVRLIAGLASAVVFVYCAGAVAGTAAAGVAFCGVGVGIAASGVLVVALGEVVGWQVLWWVAAVATAVFGLCAWRLQPGGAPSAVPDGAPAPRPGVAGWALGISYFLEGLGYIVLGTFLVAAVAVGGRPWEGPAAWVIVGFAAAVSPLIWARLRRYRSAESLLVIALLLQVVSAVLPALVHGPAAAAVSAVLFGGTFIGAVQLSMEAGARIGIPRSAAVLTAGYGIGQIVGPLVVAPMLGDGYDAAFLTAGGVLVASAVLAAVARWTAPDRAATPSVR
ncbi:YbfB/YjiJ family MFS transporter [Tsukamurella ocularis]|uniref:YbfB/YjiJ family MFS transporter n=1 Tax=Tsukamurella ocularis TaxID=1970234 RepID=UPI0021684F75|nr:YbfB/YjiJ family MFS transporter [Tsukamurella ocularis]MCS3781234.1 putative MFS family arabinose efflux permease [Tsukamurella ocularis]MCS3787605.1 putative MFS family arabinose efflux permease [Tsukamurella ocularis]MCS3850900.1 putative MFS family arabinose efflux permease [Tsukamurella ocularis]